MVSFLGTGRQQARLARMKIAVVRYGTVLEICISMLW